MISILNDFINYDKSKSTLYCKVKKKFLELQMKNLPGYVDVENDRPNRHEKFKIVGSFN
jgi:hypothetical protein